MSLLLTLEEIIKIHDHVVNNSKAEPGVLNEGMVEVISKKPELVVSGEELYKNIYQKGASLMESIIRLHPFVDGNKRTSLAVLIEYLWINEYIIFLPLSSVRRTVIIAMNAGQDQDSINNLVNDTSMWIEKYAIEQGDGLRKRLVKLMRSLSEPLQLYFLWKFRMKTLLIKRITNWFAFDIFPRDPDEIVTSADFIHLKIRDVTDRLRKDLENIRK